MNLNGSFIGWCGEFTNMTSIGNNIWATTLTLDTAAKIVGTYCWNTCTICDAIGVNEQALNSMKVYPNPASESLFIDLGTVSEKDAKVKVCNMLGEVMISKTNIQNNTYY